MCRKPKQYKELHPKSQKQNLKKFNEEIVAVVCSILEERDPDLVATWVKEYGWDPRFESYQKNPEPEVDPIFPNPLEAVCQNVVKFFHSLPATSLIRTIIIRDLFENAPNNFIAERLDLTVRRIQIANQSDNQPLPYYLNNLAIPRNRLGFSETHVLNWILMVCLIPSGRNRRCFFGTFGSMYAEYYTWTVQFNFPSVSPGTFNSLRRRENVWLLKGDIFVDPGQIRMKVIERELELLKKALPESQQEVTTLEKEHERLHANDEFAKQRIGLYCKAHKDLEQQPTTVVCSLDFTAMQTSMANKYVDFVVVMASKSPIQLPESLFEAEVEPIQPESLRVCPEVSRPTPKKRPKPLTTKKVDTPNLRKDVTALHKRKKLTITSEPPNVWKPSLHYFHFVLKKTDRCPAKQTFDYVQWVFEFLFRHKVFDPFEQIKLWSDGCGKHFKTYSAHFFMSYFQQTIKKIITWDFLAPNRAHNRCDAAAAHIKGQIDQHIQNYYNLSEVSHLAFACSKLKNMVLVEADFEEFPDVEISIPVDETFMREAFSFEYRPPIEEQLFCKHKCNNKQTCSHPCCRPRFCQVVSLVIKMRDGGTLIRKLKSVATSSELTTLEPLQEDEFWSSQDRVVAIIPVSSTRASQAHHEKDFNYLNVSCDDPSEVSETNFP